MGLLGKPKGLQRKVSRMDTAAMLLTAGDIRQALGGTYQMMRDNFDPLIIERHKTSPVAKGAFAMGPDVCAACGEHGKGMRLQAAHIVSLQECGETTTDNLVPLCERPGRKDDAIGCHQLFDSGYASVREVENCRQAWLVRNALFPLRGCMTKRYHKHAFQPSTIGSKAPDKIQSLLTTKGTRAAIREAEKRLVAARLESDRFRLRLKIVEIMRRRSARGKLELAAQLYRELENEQSVPQDMESWFYYEGGYINLLLCHHEKARDFFQRSLDFLDKSTAGWEGKWAAATSLVVLCTIALKGRTAPLAELRKVLSKARSIAGKASELHGTRWINNCNWHLVSMSLVSGDVGGADKAHRTALDHWHTMTVLEGWDNGSRPTLLNITGNLLAQKANSTSDAKEALRYLTRALVGLVGARRYHPEGARDLLFAAEKMLRIIGKTSDADLVRDVALRTRDGSSWMQPYRDS